jgi:hypothetical protein
LERPAVDVWAPASPKPGERLPGVLQQAHYWRTPDIRFSFSLFSGDGATQFDALSKLLRYPGATIGDRADAVAGDASIHEYAMGEGVLAAAARLRCRGHGANTRRRATASGRYFAMPRARRGCCYRW